MHTVWGGSCDRSIASHETIDETWARWAKTSSSWVGADPTRTALVTSFWCNDTMISFFMDAIVGRSLKIDKVADLAARAWPQQYWEGGKTTAFRWITIEECWYGVNQYRRLCRLFCTDFFPGPRRRDFWFSLLHLKSKEERIHTNKPRDYVAAIWILH